MEQYRNVQTGANIRFGGRHSGKSIASYQVEIALETNGVPIAPPIACPTAQAVACMEAVEDSWVGERAARDSPMGEER